VSRQRPLVSLVCGGQPGSPSSLNMGGRGCTACRLKRCAGVLRAQDKPPRVRFTSEVFHPNVYSDGTICLCAQPAAPTACFSGSSVLGQSGCCGCAEGLLPRGLCREGRSRPGQMRRRRDIIQDQWSPCHNVCTILTSIQSLLTGALPACTSRPPCAASAGRARMQLRCPAVRSARAGHGPARACAADGLTSHALPARPRA